MDLAALLFSFAGRLNRGKFWLGIIILCLMHMAFIVLFWTVKQLASWTVEQFVYLTVSRYYLRILGNVVSLLYVLLSFWVMVALCVKRIHDVGMSAWPLIVGFANPPFLVLFLGLLEGTKGDNRFGSVPSSGSLLRDG
jgi:uncharacterized membrane protein YhaH (DUF805 family)